MDDTIKTEADAKRIAINTIADLQATHKLAVPHLAYAVRVILGDVTKLYGKSSQTAPTDAPKGETMPRNEAALVSLYTSLFTRVVKQSSDSAAAMMKAYLKGGDPLEYLKRELGDRLNLSGPRPMVTDENGQMITPTAVTPSQTLSVTGIPLTPTTARLKETLDRLRQPADVRGK